MNTQQSSLFDSVSRPQDKPLAARMRPSSLEEFVGLSKLLKINPVLKAKPLQSLILSGPPGSGKTTLAQLLCLEQESKLYPFNAVLGGVKDLKLLIEEALQESKEQNFQPVIFIDEIHRFNKSQQDALLPYVEEGQFTFIGATTENPRVSVNRALLSRVRVIKLQKLETEDLSSMITAALKKLDRKIDQEVIEYLATNADGDARRAYNLLESLLQFDEPSTENIKELTGTNNKVYDKGGDRHYDVISAFIKSLRGSDPDAAVLWLAVMLEGGEDPMFIARRLVIFASEDIGNADPGALTLAVSALNVVEKIGMPEARISLAHATTYLASTQKSNASYQAINKAMAYVRDNPTVEVPTHLRNHHPDKKNYLYPHNFDGHFVKQQYQPSAHKFYEPTEIGVEEKIKKRLKDLWN